MHSNETIDKATRGQLRRWIGHGDLTQEQIERCFLRANPGVNVCERIFCSFEKDLTPTLFGYLKNRLDNSYTENSMNWQKIKKLVLLHPLLSEKDQLEYLRKGKDFTRDLLLQRDNLSQAVFDKCLLTPISPPFINLICRKHNTLLKEEHRFKLTGYLIHSLPDDRVVDTLSLLLKDQQFKSVVACEQLLADRYLQPIKSCWKEINRSRTSRAIFSLLRGLKVFSLHIDQPIFKVGRPFSGSGETLYQIFLYFMCSDSSLDKLEEKNLLVLAALYYNSSYSEEQKEEIKKEVFSRLLHKDELERTIAKDLLENFNKNQTLEV